MQRSNPKASNSKFKFSNIQPLVSYLEYIRKKDPEIFILLLTQWNRSSRFWFTGDQSLEVSDQKNKYDKDIEVVFEQLSHQFKQRLESINLELIFEISTIEQIHQIKVDLLNAFYQDEQVQRLFSDIVNDVVNQPCIFANQEINKLKAEQLLKLKNRIAITLTFKLMSYFPISVNAVSGIHSRAYQPLIKKIFNSELAINDILEELIQSTLNEVFTKNIFSLTNFTTYLEKINTHSFQKPEEKKVVISNAKDQVVFLKNHIDQFYTVTMNSAGTAKYFLLLGNAAKVRLNEELFSLLNALQQWKKVALTSETQFLTNSIIADLCRVIITYIQQRYPEIDQNDSRLASDLHHKLNRLRATAYQYLSEILLSADRRSCTNEVYKQELTDIMINFVKETCAKRFTSPYFAELLNSLSSINFLKKSLEPFIGELLIKSGRSSSEGKSSIKKNGLKDKKTNSKQKNKCKTALVVIGKEKHTVYYVKKQYYTIDVRDNILYSLQDLVFSQTLLPYTGKDALEIFQVIQEQKKLQSVKSVISYRSTKFDKDKTSPSLPTERIMSHPIATLDEALQSYEKQTSKSVPRRENLGSIIMFKDKNKIQKETLNTQDKVGVLRKSSSLDSFHFAAEQDKTDSDHHDKQLKSEKHTARNVNADIPKPNSSAKNIFGFLGYKEHKKRNEEANDKYKEIGQPKHGKY